MAPLPARPQPTVEAIDALYVARQDDGYRDHLGASLIGTECTRSLWYSFRWATRARHTGRLLRLFERGQLEEARFIAALRAIGVTVMDIDPETGRQWTVRDSSGHVGGSMDAVCIGLPEAEKTYHLLEFKTHSAKSFTSLVKDGVEKSKPLHYAQMLLYMELSGLTRAMYLAVNKDDEQLYSERVHADPAQAMRLIAKGQRVVQTTTPPERISTDPAWFQCKFCDHRPVCWEGELPARHCRSCLHSSPIENGSWRCEKHDRQISTKEQRAGCPDHLLVPQFVAGEQIDADENSVTYRLKDGTIWKDQACPF